MSKACGRYCETEKREGGVRVRACVRAAAYVLPLTEVHVCSPPTLSTHSMVGPVCDCCEAAFECRSVQLLCVACAAVAGGVLVAVSV